MIIGIDFDNTIVDYTGVFFQAARQSDLIPENIDQSKSGVKSYFINNDRERDWTILQGKVYGTCMNLAKPYTGIDALFQFFDANAIPYFIVSHKTKHPIIGPPHNLHAAATSFLEKNLFFSRFQLSKEQVYFEPNMESKSSRIERLGCTHFIDDLEKFLCHESFPTSCKKLHFDPGQKSRQKLSFASHAEILNYIKDSHE